MSHEAVLVETLHRRYATEFSNVLAILHLVRAALHEPHLIVDDADAADRRGGQDCRLFMREYEIFRTCCRTLRCSTSLINSTSRKISKGAKITSNCSKHPYLPHNSCDEMIVINKRGHSQAKHWSVCKTIFVNESLGTSKWSATCRLKMLRHAHGICNPSWVIPLGWSRCLGDFSL